MQPNEVQPVMTVPEAPKAESVLRADDRTRHHKKIMTITALGFITVLIALGLVAWFVRQAEIKEQMLQNEYRAESFQHSAQEAQAFFAAYPQSKDPKVVAAAQAASQKTAATFFKNNPVTPATSAQITVQAAQLQAMYQQGFADWKAMQPK